LKMGSGKRLGTQGRRVGMGRRKMKTILMIGVVVLLTAGCVHVPPQRDGDAMGAYETVMVDLLKKSRPQGSFAMALLWDSRQTNRLVAYPSDVVSRVLQSADIPKQWLVPLEDVRLPEEGEMDPKDAKRYRGVETLSKRERIELYAVMGLQIIGADEIEVFWVIYTGPLAARGGSMRLKREQAGYKVVESLGGWVS
jgi:hypothetical protein